MNKTIDQRITDEFLPSVREIFGESLTSVVLYGSGADGTYRPKLSDVNILILLDEPQPQLLERFAREARRTIKKMKITPMVMSEREYTRGSDVFPMEYLDIRERHLLLHGRDVTAELEFSHQHLRHQLEHQLRGALFSLRQLLLAARGRKRLLARELPRWYGTLQALFNGLLRLVEPQERLPASREVLTRLADRFSFDAAPFDDLLALREGGKVDARELSYRLVYELAKLVDDVDRWEGREE